MTPVFKFKRRGDNRGRKNDLVGNFYILEGEERSVNRMSSQNILNCLFKKRGLDFSVKLKLNLREVGDGLRRKAYFEKKAFLKRSEGVNVFDRRSRNSQRFEEILNSR